MEKALVCLDTHMEAIRVRIMVFLDMLVLMSKVQAFMVHLTLVLIME